MVPQLALIKEADALDRIAAMAEKEQPEAMPARHQAKSICSLHSFFQHEREGLKIPSHGALTTEN
jgi:hypothetical protein